ncbi:formyltetrahydrofolate deformylase [Tsuneonella sp. HG249]
MLSFSAPDQPGIVARVSSCVAALGCDIRDAQVHGDAASGLFFVRLVLVTPVDRDEVAAALGPVARSLQLEWRLESRGRKVPTVIAVSRFGHCLTDLIHRTDIGMLPIVITGVVSNHEIMRDQVEWHGLPFHRLPSGADKPAQEDRIREVMQGSGAELLVLARYMQVLSADLADELRGRCINIHHSFLPSFAGAKPYHQAHERGVKIIGATAHYVTADLDEGPIIEQDVRRVTHASSPEAMVAAGREVEASVLARAVQWHAEQRVFLDGNRTVVLA